MAKVAVLSKSFNNEQGEPVNYKVVAITGVIDGITHTLELRANKSELLLAEILLNSEDQPATTHARKITVQEEESFLDGYESDEDK